jgi:hypothetical protein
MYQQSLNPFLPPSHDIFVEDTQAEWNAAAAASLSRLIPTPAENTDGSDDLLKSSLSCHVYLVSLLLFIPRKDLLAFAHTHRTDQERCDSAAKHNLALWMRAQQGQKARQAVIYAGTLFRLLRKHPCQGFHEPITALLVTLVIWAYSQLAQTSAPYHSHSTSGSGERGLMVRLDRVLSDEAEKAWVEGKQGLRGHLTDVGNIAIVDAGSRLLSVGGVLLSNMDTWALSQGLAVWLAKLRARSAAAPMTDMRSVGSPSHVTYA